MLRRITYVFIPLVLATWTSVPAVGQNRRAQDLKVEIQGLDSIPFGYSLQLVDVAHRSFAGSADADVLGGFSFHSVPPGDYMARLVDSNGNVIREEMIRFDGINSVVRFTAPRLSEKSRPTGERISVRQLQNPPSKKAIKAVVEAQKYSEAGQHDKAAAALEKAIQLSPDFAVAHTNLGAQYLHLRQYEKAIEEANRAMESGSPNVHDLGNRGLALWALGRLAEAMESAKQALTLDSRAATAHYILGSLLSMKADTLPEAIKHLEIAAEKNASAAKNLAAARQLLAAR